MKKRLLSVLLTLCMILTLLPVSAFAVNEESKPMRQWRLSKSMGCLEISQTIAIR